MSKYNNKIVEVSGVQFHSKVEAQYFQQLKWAKEAKAIKSFELQPKFILQDKFKKNGKHHRAITYIADFKVIGLDGTTEIIDIKGAPLTETFKIKRKLFEYKFPELSLKCLYYTKAKGWYER